MSDRPTKELKTAHGHTVVLYEWITREEFRRISAFSAEQQTEEVRIDAKNETVEGKGTSITDAATALEEFLVEIIVRSIDGSAENLAARFATLPNVDTSEILEEIGDIVSPKKKSKAPSLDTQPTEAAPTSS